MKELLLYVAKQLVDDPEAVTVTEREDGESTVLELHVARGYGQGHRPPGDASQKRSGPSSRPSPSVTASASPLTLWTDANSLAASLQRAFCISPLFWPRRPACMPLSCTQTCHGGTAVMKSEQTRARALRRQLTATFYRKNKATFFVTAGAMLLARRRAAGRRLDPAADHRHCLRRQRCPARSHVLAVPRCSGERDDDLCGAMLYLPRLSATRHEAV